MLRLSRNTSLLLIVNYAFVELFFFLENKLRKITINFYFENKIVNHNDNKSVSIKQKTYREMETLL